MNVFVRLAILLLPIIFLAGCADDSEDTQEARWKRAYDAGLAAQEAGDMEKAEKSFRQSITVLKSEPPGEKRAQSCLNLASLLMEKHDCAGALTSGQEAMVFFENKWNPLKSTSSLDQTGPNFLSSMLIVGRALNCQQRYAEALPLLRRARSLQENVIVPLKFNHELTEALRVALAKTGNRQESWQLHDEIRSTESSLPSSDLADVSRLNFEKALKEGKSAQLGGNYDSAEKLLKRALSGAEQKDPQSIKTAEALLGLGDLYGSQAKYTQAQPLLERALNIARKRLPKGDRELKEYMKRLASTYANQSQWQKAAALDEEALELIFANEYKLDKHVHRSRDLMDALIDIYKKDGQLDKAEKIARRKLDLEKEGYGKGSRKVGITSCQLAEILELRKKYEQAQTYFDTSLAVLKSSKNTDPRELDKTYQAYSKFLDRKGDKLRAQQLRDEAKKMNDEILDGLAGKDR